MTNLQYEIWVAGSVPADVLNELDDVRVITHSVETVLRGPVQDQAALIGIINRLQGWGLELHAVRQLEPAPLPGPNPAGTSSPATKSSGAFQYRRASP